jgi:hypothetical protein
VLNNCGLTKYLTGVIGGSMKIQDAKCVVSKIVKLLAWAYKNGHIEERNNNDPMSWYKEIIVHKYHIIEDYCTYLEKVKELAPDTIKNNLASVKTGASWCILVYIKNDKTKTLTTECMAGFTGAISALRKAYLKEFRKKRSSKTMQSEVYQRKQPVNGISDLQGTFTSEIEWVKGYVKLIKEYEDLHGGRPYYPMTNVEYTRFTQAMYGSIYAFAANGRVGGIEDLKENQYEQLVEEGHVHSSKFKTYARYGYQPVILSVVSFFFVKNFWEHFRPVAIQNLEFSNGGLFETTQRSLWLTFDGKPDKIGPRVTQYFKRTLQLHITTTAIRSLVETTTETLAREGGISSVQREAVSNINGHTSEVTRDYYLRMDRTTDVHRARQAMNIATDSPSSPGNLLEPPLTWDNHSKETLCAADWGTKHPDYQKTTVKGQNVVKRATWTEEEIRYIADYCVQKVEENPEAKSTICASCLEYIHTDPEALPIFHANHVLDSARLRTGYRQAIKRGWIPSSWNY